MRVKAQKIPQKKISPEQIIALFCYHYQQYTFKQARNLPYKRVVMMLKVAEKEHAKRMFELTRIVAAPHTKKGSGVKSVLSYYESIIKG